MRHRVRGRKLGRTSSHRKAMFRNMACSLIRSVRVDDDDPQKPGVPGRIVTTVEKAKELRPFIEKLVTIARKAISHERNAEGFTTSAVRNSASWKSWRDSDQWNQWNQAIAPAVAYRRRAFAMLRNRHAVDILFEELAERFEERPGGYTRIVKLPKRRLGDAGAQALIEFVGERDRVRVKRRAPIVTDVDESSETQGSAADSETASETTAEKRTETDVTDESEAASDNVVVNEAEETVSKVEPDTDADNEPSES